MKRLRVAFGALALAALLLKLFTFEFYLAGDPTSGVAWRGVPSFSSYELMRDHEGQKHRVLLQSENEFLYAGLYRAVVNWGWIVLLGASAVTFFVPRPSAGITTSPAP